MYLVKNMSLAEVNTEDVWNGDHESDQMRKSKSLVIIQQFAETFHNTGEDDGTKASEEYVPATRRRAMTKKGRDYKLKIMKERRQKLHKRIQRSWNTIEELQLSERNMAPVQQELAQFNDVYKLFVNLHEELNPRLEDSERAADDEWFEDIDERVCTFKRKTHNWQRVAEDNQHSRCPSSRSKGNSNAISMCIVPVKVYDSDKGREMMTYVMLDNCSQGSFISESLVKQMNLSGRKTTLNQWNQTINII